MQSASERHGSSAFESWPEAVLRRLRPSPEPLPLPLPAEAIKRIASRRLPEMTPLTYLLVDRLDADDDFVLK